MRPEKTAYPLFLLVARLVVAGVFISASIGKVLDPEAFERAVLSYRVVGTDLAPWLALVLPWLELVAGFGLLVVPLRRSSGLVISILLAAFIGAHAAAWARGLDIACGCFGEGSGEAGYPWLILRNAGLLAAAVWATWESFRNTHRNLPSRALGPMDCS